MSPADSHGPAITLAPLTVRWHGRGGFGAKTAASLLAELAIAVGGYGQASPEFGPERRGAPVQAYTRIGPRPIRARGPIAAPDVLAVLDHRLLADSSTTAGAGPRTRIIVNAPFSVIVPGIAPDQVTALDASRIARVTVGRDIPNVPMLAAVVALHTPIGAATFLWWLGRRLREEFRREVVAANVEAARLALEEVTRGRTALAGA